MSAIKAGLVAVLAIGGSLLTGASAKAQYYYPAYPPAVVVAPAPVVYATPVYGGLYGGPVLVRRPVVRAVGVATWPVRRVVPVVRPRAFIW